jgi:hypothetical protein
MRNLNREVLLMSRYLMSDTDATRYCAWDEQCKRAKGSCNCHDCKGPESPVHYCGAFHKVYAAYVGEGVAI